MRKGNLLLPVPHHVTSQTMTILNNMRKDEVYTAAVSDPLILQFAHKLTAKHYHDPDLHDHVRNKVREVGRLLVQVRKDHGMSSLSDALNPAHFSQLATSVRKVAGFNPETNSFASPSLALKLGHSLKKCAMSLLGIALRSGTKDDEDKANGFIRLCDIEWADEVSRRALCTLRDHKLNKVSILPLAEDISKMHDFLTRSAAEALQVFENDTSDADMKRKAWSNLAQLMLAQLILFNRRRVGEVSKMTMENWNAVNCPSNDDVAQHLSSVERQLCRSLSRIQVIGKRGNHVPVLLTAASKSALTVLVSKRTDGDVPASNPYVFAQPRTNGHIRGADVMRKFSTECGAKLPHALRGTQLRKHVATISQLLNLKENELDILAQFLGHDVRVHREFYRLPSDILQTAKVSKILLAMENGQQGKLTGQSLDEIEVNFHEGNILTYYFARKSY